MKKFARVLSLLLVLAVLTGCGASTKTYTCGELSMTVPSGMLDASSQSDFSDYTFALDSTRIAVFGLQESFAEYPVLAEYSLKEYADLLIQANGLDALAVERSSSDYMYFDYTANNENGTYRYLVGAFESDEGFWMVQICSLVTDFDEETFLGYLDSVSFS